jgi:hypothetical protein
VDDRPLETWELETISRSLAMAPSVPADQVRRLLAEIARLRAGLEQLSREADELRRMGASGRVQAAGGRETEGRGA